MSDELYETSSIPDQPSYWNGLAARVTAAVTTDRAGVIATLGASRWCLPAAAACLVAAAAIGSIAIRRDVASDLGLPVWQAALASKDDLGRKLTTADRPPAVAWLLPVGALAPLGER